MNIFIQTTKDTKSDEGLKYFISLFGFPSGYIGEQIPIQSVTPENPMIIDDKIHGWVIWKDAKLPVLQKPDDLSHLGEELLTYTDGTVTYSCAVMSKNGIIISLDIFSHLGLFVSGHMEKILNPLKDQKNKIIIVPFADYYCDFLFSCIRIVQKTAKIPLVHKSFWPEGKTCAVCLTHDVDEVKKTYQWVTYPLKFIRRGQGKNLRSQFHSFIQKLRGNEPFWTFDEIIRIEGSRGVTSSFYFLKETGKVRLFDTTTWRHFGRRYDFNAPHVKELLHNLYSHDWEVGLHGSFYSYLDPEKLRFEKEALEHALGTPVTGGRQHNLNLKIPETWLHQERAGLLYDTTLGYNDCCGFRWGISFPFRPFYPEENRSLNVLQIPLVIEDLPYFRCQEPLDAFLTIFNHVEALHGVLTLLWHHTVFNENEFPGGASDYVKIIEYCKKQDAWIGSGRQILAWWTRREKTTIDWVFDGKTVKISPSPKEQEHYITLYMPDSMKITEIKNALVIRSDNHSCELKMPVLPKGESVEITVSGD